MKLFLKLQNKLKFFLLLLANTVFVLFSTTLKKAKKKFKVFKKKIIEEPKT